MAFRPVAGSMFGFQRIGDFSWAAGDSRARGFLIGGTSGRTTLAGEGLQHQDGHSHLLAASLPSCIGYDPTFAFEIALIVQEGLRRMVELQEDIFYYLTVANENYAHPLRPEGSEEGVLRGMYRFKDAGTGARSNSWARAPSSMKSSPPPGCSNRILTSAPMCGV